MTRCDAKLLGLASNALGAGRNHVEDIIHPAVGLYLEKKLGDRVKRGEILCQIHWNDESPGGGTQIKNSNRGVRSLLPVSQRIAIRE